MCVQSGGSSALWPSPMEASYWPGGDGGGGGGPAGELLHPLRRARSEVKKCRKVYGIEQRHLWCIQCKCVSSLLFSSLLLFLHPARTRTRLLLVLTTHSMLMLCYAMLCCSLSMSCSHVIS